MKLKRTDEAAVRLLLHAPIVMRIVRKLVDWVGDEDCDLDHHGYCQAHFLEDATDEGCTVAIAKACIEIWDNQP